MAQWNKEMYSKSFKVFIYGKSKLSIAENWWSGNGNCCNYMENWKLNGVKQYEKRGDHKKLKWWVRETNNKTSKGVRKVNEIIFESPWILLLYNIITQIYSCITVYEFYINFTQVLLFFFSLIFKNYLTDSSYTAVINYISAMYIYYC